MLDGILLVDKPRGMTSFDVIRKISRLIPDVKIGHAGTLDPDASGLLVICLGHATKISNYMLADSKVYDVEFKVGIETDTFDDTGEIVSESDVTVGKEKVEETLGSFLGEIAQQVPLFSAVKVAGKKLYEYARKKEEVLAPTKTVTIHSLTLNSYVHPIGSARVFCSKGTYIRSLIHDLGRKLGTGAVTTHIRRVQSGKFTLESALDLPNILRSTDPRKDLSLKVRPISSAVDHLPKIHIPPNYLSLILHGTGLNGAQWSEVVPQPATLHGEVLICDEAEKVLGLGHASLEKGLEIKRLLISVA